jgi:hypothetical protein
VSTRKIAARRQEQSDERIARRGVYDADQQGQQAPPSHIIDRGATERERTQGRGVQFEIGHL